MEKQNMRVIVASEYPEVQHLLRSVVEKESGTVTVGQAQTVSTAVTLAKSLRPDIVIVDCYLPYAIGLDTLPLSRIGGLDTAQAISEQIPNTRVVLLSNLNAEGLPELGLNADNAVFFSRKTSEANTPFTLRELYQETKPLSSLVFADIEVQQQVALQQKMASISDKAIFFGGLGIACGLLLTITVIFAPAGVLLGAVGTMTLLFGLARKMIPSLWHKSQRGKSKPQEKNKRRAN